MLRSIGAVLLGIIVIGLTAVGADLILRALLPGAFTQSGGRVDSAPILLLTLSYTLLFLMVGGYVTAWLAQRAELKHALILAVIQWLFTLLATIQFWPTAPAWYHLAILVLLGPAVVGGGYGRKLQKDRRRSFDLVL